MNLQAQDMRAAVIGAGFSGLMFALSLAQGGVNVDLYEEHNRVGYPEHCTGLVSKATQDMIGRPALRSELGTIGSFVIAGPRLSLRLRASQPIVKLDRVRLEELMLEEAEAEGVNFISGAKVRPLPSGEVLPPGRSYDVIVLAEGFNGRLRGPLGIGFSGHPLFGVNAEFEGGGEADFVARFDRSTSDGFFSWKVSVDGLTVVGTASRDPRGLGRLLEESMRVHGAEGKPLKTYGGPILTGPMPRRVRLGRVIAVGDAASMNKPLTGGGLYPSAAAARRAQALINGGARPADAVEEAVLGVLKVLRRTYRLSRLLHGRPEAVDVLIRAATDSGLAERVSGRIDYDVHDSLFRESIKSWRFYLAAADTIITSPVTSLRLLASLLADMI
ncbi:dehydrogenase (flavoprotein)-like protein [Acidilobus saccharovorans 345-15]|uniref:Dehydrogenase (Flavoprotein)-like protein n=2 Tax=Acidilobus TaxID=105850 RepID=D9Q346_ACIS3|nr:dehydrogenase (flavoprotein)-like protein [Acidilobus saccharovorans 345-15]